jgi:hypothetical protein
VEAGGGVEGFKESAGIVRFLHRGDTGGAENSGLQISNLKFQTSNLKSEILNYLRAPAASETLIAECGSKSRQPFSF